MSDEPTEEGPSCGVLPPFDCDRPTCTWPICQIITPEAPAAAPVEGAIALPEELASVMAPAAAPVPSNAELRADLLDAVKPAIMALVNNDQSDTGGAALADASLALANEVLRRRDVKRELVARMNASLAAGAGAEPSPDA